MEKNTLAAYLEQIFNLEKCTCSTKLYGESKSTLL